MVLWIKKASNKIVKKKKSLSGSTIDLTVCIQNNDINRKKTRQRNNSAISLIFSRNMMNFLLLIFTILYYSTQLKAQYYPYKHYSRQPASETVYNNETIAANDEDSNMCQLSVRCPSIVSLGK